MKSRLFNKKMFLTSEKFKQDLVKYLNYFDDVNVYKELPQISTDIHLSNTEHQADQIFFEAAKKLNIDESKLRASFNLIAVFVIEFSPEGEAYEDTVESLIEDIKSIDLPEPIEWDKLKNTLDSAKKVAIERYYVIQKQIEYETAGLPNLMDISSTVNLRAIFDKTYKEETVLTDYTPECEKLVPVAIIKLKLDIDDTPDNLCFQIAGSRIRRLINQLEALEKQISVTTEYINKKIK